jgi:hypothetical protein
MWSLKIGTSQLAVQNFAGFPRKKKDRNLRAKE